MIKVMPVGIPVAKAGGFVCPQNKWTPVPPAVAAALMEKYPNKLYVVNTSTGEVQAKPESIDQAVDVAPAPAPAPKPAPAPVVVDPKEATAVDIVPAMGVIDVTAAVVQPVVVDEKPKAVDVTNAAVEPQVADDLSVADKVRKVAPQLTDDDIMALEAAPVDTWTVDYICKATNVKGKVAKLILKAVSG